MGEAGRRACAASVLLPLTTPAVVARKAAVPPQLDGVRAVARLVAEPGYGSDAAWAAIFSNAKYTGILPGEGAVPVFVVTAREQLVSVLWERKRGERPRGGSADSGHSIGARIETAGEGRRPYHTESHAGSYDGSVMVGRWGVTEGDTVAADIATAMGVLGNLLHDAHCAAGRGFEHGDQYFGLVQLTRQAGARDGSLEHGRGLRLFREVFRRFTSPAGRRRYRAGAAVLDIGAVVARVLEVDLEKARSADLVVRTAREAARDSAKAGDGGGRPQTGAHGSAAAQTMRDMQPAAKLLSSVGLPPPPPTSGGPQAAAAAATAHTAEEKAAAARLRLAAPPSLAHHSIYMKCGR
eukprot:6210174-Pleurochrysis_carterae.AAC.2